MVPIPMAILSKTVMEIYMVYVQAADLQAQLVVAGLPGIDHLGLRLQVLVEREQRVEDEIAEIAADVGGGPNRVDAAQVGLGNEPQGLAGGLRRDAERRESTQPGQGDASEPRLPTQCAHRSPCSDAFLGMTLRDPFQGS